MTTVSGSYTIQKGDNLWNIVKSNYKTANGEQLTNTQIANTIKQIAKDNNIEDANLIFAGTELTLNEFDGFELQIETDEVDETEAETEAAEEAGEDPDAAKEAETELYNNFAQWSAQNTKDFYDVGLLAQDLQQEAFKVVEAQTFSFGTNDSEEEYEKGLTEITTGQLAKYETNDEYGINLEEFLKGSIAENNELTDEQVEIDDNVITAWAKTYEMAPGESEIDENEAPEMAALKEMTNTFNFFDFNGNNILEADEMKLYYTVLDTTDGTKDGTIEYKSYVAWKGTFTTPSADRTSYKEQLKDKFYQKYGKTV